MSNTIAADAAAVVDAPIDWSTWYRDEPKDPELKLERWVYCLHCSYKSHYPSDARRHVKLVHLNQRQFPCSECKQVFKQMDKLQRHQRDVHVMEKPHKCDLCQRTFREMNKLSDHLHSHINDRPHACEVMGCAKTFNTRTTLNQHVRQHHLNIRNFECYLCHQRFFLAKQLRRHQSKPCGPPEAEAQEEKESEIKAFEPNATSLLNYAPSIPVLNPPEGVMPQYTFPCSYGKAVRPSRKNRVWLNSETATIGTEISETEYQAEALRAAVRSK